MNVKIYLSVIVGILFCLPLQAQEQNRWQQAIDYKMEVDVDVVKNILKGTQKITYYNNAPEKLDKLFIHLYWNAFKPNSGMDNRSRELGKNLVNGKPDWDSRVKDHIENLREDEIGYQKIISLKMNGVDQPFEYYGTILKVNLLKPISAKSKVQFDVVFESQVPLQIRRSGRDNPKTGVRYSMSQWYPKIAEYDYAGWHPTPYIAREFYGVWGDYDVKINIDKAYKLGGTGVLQNANEIGWGYDKPGTELKPTSKAKRSWHFVGKNIHDFVWAADPDYKHIVRKIPGRDVTIHVIYNYPNKDAVTDSAWTVVADAAVKVLPFIEKNFGAYAYPQYSFIQGGDGGMEYPMATLIQSANLGTVFHEWMHSWYQMMLGVNESLYPWMDEGFTSYADDLVMKYYLGKSSLQIYRDTLAVNPNKKGLKDLIDMMPEDHSGSYASYFSLVRSGLEEPMTTHADHYDHNFAYSVAAYSKGEILLEQLGYIIGADVRDKILLNFYDTWKFKHPNGNDFFKIAQDVSGLQLDWYKMYWVNTTKTIDYAIDSLWEVNGATNIRLKRIGKMPMPIDLQLNLADGTTQMHNIPLNLMYGSKANEKTTTTFSTHTYWNWANPLYTLTIPVKLRDLKKIEIDPSKRMADIYRRNNILELNW